MEISIALDINIDMTIGGVPPPPPATNIIMVWDENTRMVWDENNTMDWQ